MKMDFIYTLAVTAALSFCSCTEIEDGAPINFDEWEAPAVSYTHLTLPTKAFV